MRIALLAAWLIMGYILGWYTARMKEERARRHTIHVTYDQTAGVYKARNAAGLELEDRELPELMRRAAIVERKLRS